MVKTGFDTLGLDAQILQAVADSGYTTPTPIQAQGIPVVLQRRDLIGIAQTGTGKTASFTLPMIEMLSRGRAKARMPRALVLEPTRELADQVSENFDKYSKYSKLSHALLIGGGMVAENSSVWRWAGSFSQMNSISGMKPMSSMRSASSITRILTWDNRMRPRSK